MPSRPIKLPEQARVVNVGLSLFGDAVREQGAPAVDVDWRIPAGGRPDLVAMLQRLYGPYADRIDAANQEALRRINEGMPMLTSIAPARDVVSGVESRMVLHCGNALPWQEFCDPLRRSVRAAVIAEGWASSPDEAEQLVARGSVRLEPANDHDAVIPMASAIGPSTPVLVVDNEPGGRRAFSSLNQGSGQVAWFGVETQEAVDRLAWLRDVAADVLAATLRSSGPVDVFSLVSQGLQMGDDVHMRTQATTNLLLRHWLPHLVSVDSPHVRSVAQFLSSNHLFFLNLAMAGAKSVADWVGEVGDSSIVCCMTRNGTTFGIRVSALAGRWFTTPAPPVSEGLYYPGYGPETSAPDIGDSAVLELVGLGGAAAAASPAVAGFMGGSMQDAINTTLTMDRICAGQSTRFKLPMLDFRGTPIAVDVRRVVELDITPAINTGILHVSAGTGQVGAGVAHAPIQCFQEAALALDATFA
jgi:hypothetical protein